MPHLAPITSVMLGTLTRFLGSKGPEAAEALFVPPEEVRVRRDSLDRREEIQASVMTPGRRALLIGSSALNAYGALSGQTIVQHQSQVWSSTDVFEKTQRSR